MSNYIKRLFKLLNTNYDKVLHFSLSANLVFFFSIWLSLNASCASVITLGIAKEIWDKCGNGTPDVKDFIADCLGVLFAYVIYGLVFLK